MGQEPEELRADIEDRRERMSETVDAIGDRVSPTRIAQRRVGRAKGWVGGVRQKVMGSAEYLPSRAAMPHPGVDQVQGAAQSVAEKVGAAPAAAARQAQGNPLIAGALAFGLGALVASLLPESRPEHRAVEQVQPQLEAVTGAARDAAQGTIETVKESAHDAAHDLKDSATEKAQTVKDAATDSAQTVKQAATSSEPPNPQ